MITKPVQTIIARDVFTGIHQLIRKSMLKYFLWTILIVFIIQTLRKVSLFTAGTLIMTVVLFLIFFGIGIGLIALSNAFYRLAMNKELLEVAMSEQGMQIASKFKGQYEKARDILPWSGLKAVKSNTDHFCFYFDKNVSTGFRINKQDLNEAERKQINQWLAGHSDFQLT